MVTREPGGSPGAEEIRNLLLSGDIARWDAETEALLMVAARRDHLVKTIRPALAAGTWVVCDRFMDSTEAYQGFAGGVPRERIHELHRLIAGNFAPDLDSDPRFAGRTRPEARPGPYAFRAHGTRFP